MSPTEASLAAAGTGSSQTMVRCSGLGASAPSSVSAIRLLCQVAVLLPTRQRQRRELAQYAQARVHPPGSTTQPPRRPGHVRSLRPALYRRRSSRWNRLHHAQGSPGVPPCARSWLTAVGSSSPCRQVSVSTAACPEEQFALEWVPLRASPTNAALRNALTRWGPLAPKGGVGAFQAGDVASGDGEGLLNVGAICPPTLAVAGGGLPAQAHPQSSLLPSVRRALGKAAGSGDARSNNGIVAPIMMSSFMGVVRLSVEHRHVLAPGNFASK